MRNFLILFEEKEGTSPLMRLLDNFEMVSIIHQVDNHGWEPFDRHNCGAMPLKSLITCLDLIYSKESVDMNQLNQIYTRTATRPLERFSKDHVLGFKMRFIPPAPNRLEKIITPNKFKKSMFKVLKKNNPVVFVVVRQDLLRWGLSKYHGDGKGNTGHLQFKLASGTIKRDEIGKINVDCRRLAKIISKCETSHAHKQDLMEQLKRVGITSYALCYEDFIEDKSRYFSRFFEQLEIGIKSEKINTAIKKGAYFKKVHSEDISEFVENHEEVKEKFGSRFHSWHQINPKDEKIEGQEHNTQPWRIAST